MIEKRYIKISFRMTETMYLARKRLHDNIREALGIPNLSDADIVELFLNACLHYKDMENLLVNRVAQAAKMKYGI